jgi:DNA phosphorothioation-dependent restriction protein DptH
MVKENSAVLDKAQEQIQNGLDVLIKAFRPRQNDQEVPDGRYWYLQLHRLIACSAKNVQDEGTFLAAMERLSAGDFEISWTAGVFTFWTDSKQPGMEEVDCWDIESNNENYEVPVYSIGYQFIKNICNGMESPIVNWDGNMVTLKPSTPAVADIEERPAEETEPEEEEVEIEILPPVVPEPEDEPVDDDDVPEPEDKQDTKNDEQSQEGAEKVTPEPPVVQQTIPQRIFLGKENGKDFYWEFGHSKLNNRHLLIFGSSGMGKTYAIQTILCEFGRQLQNSLIVDYTNGFLPNQLETATANALKPSQRFVKANKIPLDPFLKQKQDVGGGFFIENNSMDVAKRVTAIFNSVYNMGDQQTSILIDAIYDGVEAGQMKLENLIPILESYLDDGIHKKGTVQTIISKLKPFVSEHPFTTEKNDSWEGIFEDKEHLCHVFQLAGVDKETSRILIEFILWDLYAFACNSSTEKTPKVIVLDEVQNLDQKLEAPLGKILTEGRKFGLCLIAATQTLSNLDKDQQARLFQAGHKLFFGPNAPEANQYAELVMQVANSGTKEQWKAKLMSLQKGECLSIGPVLNEKTGEIRVEVHKIKISSLAERGF